jgi:hypothetical protein
MPPCTDPEMALAGVAVGLAVGVAGAVAVALGDAVVVGREVALVIGVGLEESLFSHEARQALITSANRQLSISLSGLRNFGFLLRDLFAFESNN